MKSRLPSIALLITDRFEHLLVLFVHREDIDEFVGVVVEILLGFGLL